jgi:hypothetical protein
MPECRPFVGGQAKERSVSAVERRDRKAWGVSLAWAPGRRRRQNSPCSFGSKLQRGDIERCRARGAQFGAAPLGLGENARTQIPGSHAYSWGSRPRLYDAAAPRLKTGTPPARAFLGSRAFPGLTPIPGAHAPGYMMPPLRGLKRGHLRHAHSWAHAHSRGSRRFPGLTPQAI